jgi:hypothetical protein
LSPPEREASCSRPAMSSSAQRVIIRIDGVPLRLPAGVEARPPPFPNTILGELGILVLFAQRIVQDAEVERRGRRCLI